MDAEIIHVSAIAQCASFPSSLPALWTIHHRAQPFIGFWTNCGRETDPSAPLEATQIRWDPRVPEDVFWRAFGGGADGKSTVGNAY